MKTFDVFQLPNGNYRAIKYGFNWTPLFFTWIWCFFVAKLYGWGSACLGVFIICRLVGIVISPSHNPNDFFFLILVFGILEFSFSIWFSANANNFRRKKYMELKYKLVQQHVDSTNKHQAISKARQDHNNDGGFEVKLQQNTKNLASSLRNLKSLKKRNILNDTEFKAAESRAEEVYDQLRISNEEQKRMSQEEVAKQILQAKLDNNLADLKTMYEEGIINYYIYAAAKRRLFRKKFWDNYWGSKK
jgi:hypothetical protein